MSPERIDVGELPEEAHARLIHLSNVFGRVLFDTARSPSHKGGGSLPETANTDAAAVVDRTLYGALQVLDGVNAHTCAGRSGGRVQIRTPARRAAPLALGPIRVRPLG
jgi:hypothetical protein